MNPYDDNSYARICECDKLRTEVERLRAENSQYRMYANKAEARILSLVTERDALRAVAEEVRCDKGSGWLDTTTYARVEDVLGRRRA